MKLTNGLSAVAALIAVAPTVWTARTEYGWFGLAFGPDAVFFFGLNLVWIVCVVWILARSGSRWVLVSAPFVILPLVLIGAFFVVCINGSCI